MYSDVRDFSSTSMDATYADNTNHVLLAAAPTGGTLFCVSTSTTAIALVFGSYKKGEVPSSTLPGKCIWIPPAPTGGTASIAVDQAQISKNDKIWIRSETGTISSGKLYYSIV